MTSWSDDLRTGNIRIDTQHYNICREMDLYEASMTNGRVTSRWMTIKLIDFLRDYFTLHFSEEEALMEKTGYPALGIHAEEHMRFFDTFVHHRSLIERDGTPEQLNNFFEAMRGWLTNHIHGTDKQMALWLHGRTS
jgi:hemerythrin-like metal-binding protein